MSLPPHISSTSSQSKASKSYSYQTVLSWVLIFKDHLCGLVDLSVKFTLIPIPIAK